MTILPPATFQMASQSPDGSFHQRRIERAFAIGSIAIRPVIGSSRFYSSWAGAAEFCNALSEAEGIPKSQWCYNLPVKGREFFPFSPALKPDYLSLTGYRMPTEAEWEYACRAGTPTSRYYGNSDSLLDHYVWHRGNSPENSVHPSGLLKPNDFGLFDMLGNQSVHCLGRAGKIQSAPPEMVLWDSERTDLVKSAMIATPFSQRGSSYNQIGVDARFSARHGAKYDLQSQSFGVRLVRTLPLDMCRKAFGDAHPATLGGLYNEAILAVGRSDAVRAEELDRQLLERASAEAEKDPELWETALRFAARLAARRGQTEIARSRCGQLVEARALDLSLAELMIALPAPSPAEQERQLAAAKILTDPWLKLGAAYALFGKPKQAAEACSKGIGLAPDVTAKIDLVPQLAAISGVLPALAALRRDDTFVLLAQASEFSKRGETQQAYAARMKARAWFEEKLVKEPENSALAAILADLLLLDTTAWTVLKPIAMKSEGGATLTLQKDGSIFVSGVNPEIDTYTIAAPSEGRPITAMMLETIPDSRLPFGGAGRSPMNGDFSLSEFKVSRRSAANDDEDELKITDVFADHEQKGFPLSAAVDGIVSKEGAGAFWNTYPQHRRSTG